MNKKVIIGFIFLVLMALVVVSIFLGSSGHSNTVMHAVVSNEEIKSLQQIEKTQQDSEFLTGERLYANVYFIESPRGLKYKVKWYRENKLIYEETKAMKQDKKGMLVFQMKLEKILKGNYSVEICKDNYVLKKIEFEVQ